MIRRKEAGFTIMELMVVSLIVAVVVGLALPTMSQQRADAKTNEIALDLVAVARLARSSSAAYGRAHLIRWNPALFVTGGVEVYRGINNSCNANNWPVITATNCTGGNPNCIESVDPTAYRGGSPSVYTITMTNLAGATNRPLSGGGDICFEPNGTVRWRIGTAGFFSASNSAAGVDNQGGFIFNIQRSIGGTNVGVARQTLIPMGGDARKIR